MDENVGKIYCLDRGNDDALAAAILANGNSGILQAVSNCCCETQKELIRMQGNIDLAICKQTGELRNGQRDLGVAITQGFSQVGYQQGQDKCYILSLDV